MMSGIDVRATVATLRSDPALLKESLRWQYNYERRSGHKYTQKAFTSLFTLTPFECAYIWMHYSLEEVIRDRVQLLWTLEFLTSYPVSEVGALLWGVCSKTYGETVKRVLELLYIKLDEVSIS